MRIKSIVLTLALVVPAVLSQTTKEIKLLYRIDDNDFKPHGYIKIQSDHAHIRTNDLSNDELVALKRSSDSNGLITFKAVSSESEAKTIVKSCSLYLSGLQYDIEVLLSQSRSLLGINVGSTENPDCNVQVAGRVSQAPSVFNVTARVSTARLAPVPDTATYIKRMEEERNHRMRAETKDNRSFFAKYWMYIVPAVLLLMLVSSPAPEGQVATR